MKRIVLVCLLCRALLVHAAAPPLVVPDTVLGTPGARVPPNLLMNLSLTFADAGAAYRDAYRAEIGYDGYFNARMCYRYPQTRGVPDLDSRSGHFSVFKAASARHGCGGDSFSGSFLNWATASTLDLLRLALTGGDRIVDDAALTVLARAWLPDGSFHPDFYAHPDYFPRKLLAAGTEVTPFGGARLYIVSCRNRVLFSNTARGASCDAPRFGAGGRRLVSDKYYGEFNAMVQVCDSADAASRPGLCHKAGAGAKPMGSLQAAGVRIGLMSYLSERGAGDANAYGGALRAPLKFIGAVSLEAPAFTAVVNPQPEWNAATGILAGGGVLATINQLGRSNPARLGAYPGTDPGAELFYETLRYLQGRAPSIEGQPDSDDAMPVWNRRADPVEASCQRNVVATIGHASFIEDRYVPGNTRADHLDGARAFDAVGSFDVMASARRVGALEADPGARLGNRAPRPELGVLDLLDDGGAGRGSYYLAGAAFWAHTNAIRTDKPVRVDSYALELGMPARPGASPLYLAAKYGGFDDRNGDANPFVTSAQRTDDSEWSVDGASPAAYFPAPDALAVIPATRAMVADAAGRRGRVRGASASARDGGADFLLQSSFEQWHWSGSLQRLALSQAGGALQVAAKVQWDAALLLDGDARSMPPIAPSPAPAARKLYTLAASSGALVEFTWSALAPEQRAVLDVPGLGLAADGLGQARIAYLRGERSGEVGRSGGTLRRRASALGDAPHSVPLLVAAPSPSVQAAGYPAFHAAYKGRRSAVYLGANDGMLHAFDAASGAELFAYLPQALLPALSQLSNPEYAHRPYVDASAGQGEALVGGRWRTVLASGMGMGARGVFALDVSDPAAFGDGMGALWEFTERDDAAIGHVSAPPLIVKLKAGAAQYRYFALVSSGINSDAGGALFLLALDKARAARWQAGVNYYRLTTAAAEDGVPNALAPPGLALAADGSALRAYAGDLQGRLWRFDLAAAVPSAGRLPLFIARDGAGHAQAITQAPRVVFAPGGGYLVLFGTGKFIEDRDLLAAGFAPQSLYAVHDSGAGAAPTRAELAPRLLSGSGAYAVKGADFSYSGPGARHGWYLDFAQGTRDGERSVASPVLASGTVVFDTLLPGADACSAPSSRAYVLDALSGLPFDAAGNIASGAVTGVAGQGAGAPPMLVELASADGAGPAGAGALRSYALLRQQGEGHAPAQQLLRVSVPAGRASWREVANWQELHEAALRK
ncbi:MAG: PilC/PilY family type IV pilus protein [Pseudomonadota bacterium]